MPEYPQVFNVRKMAIALATGPLALLAVITIGDLSVRQVQAGQRVEAAWCTSKDAAGNVNWIYSDTCK
jgi:hypothetical protein